MRSMIYTGLFCWLCWFAMLMPSVTNAQQAVMLPNGWKLSPAGKGLMLTSDLPLNMAITPDGHYAAITENGDGQQGIEWVDLQKQKVLSFTPVHAAWLGLAMSSDGKTLYVSGGDDNCILVMRPVHDSLVIADSLILGKPWPNKIGITGLALDEAHHILYAVTKENNSLYVVHTNSRRAEKPIPLGAEAYTCVYDAAGQKLYISLWGGDAVAVYDTRAHRIEKRIPVESHPNDMVLSRNGRYLFVANANSNSVSIIDTRNQKVIETLNCSLYPADSLTGSTTNAVALSPDEHRLYVANADNNCLAVFDVSVPGASRSLGFIPTGWYPTSVRVTGKNIWVVNGKGFESMANPYGPQPTNRRIQSPYQKNVTSAQPVQYIGSLFKGSLSVIHVPDAQQLAQYSQQVYANTPFNPYKEAEAPGVPGNPIPMKPGDSTPIKYVFYIIKENRTYDQVLGDMPEGNGDPSLCLFPDSVTPNHHALAREFVLFDNFYVDAEVSADGHNWSTAAYATDYVEKTWPTNYSGRGGNYDYEGTRQVAFPKKGFIWDYCQRAGISYRNYGEFVHNGKGNILPAIRGHYCAAFPDFDLSIQDVYREKVWEHDFDSLVAANALPRFCTLRFPDDHTSGMRRGAYTPFAALADNDLALGRFIEHLSHSPIWKECAVFVLEDDAQNGPDHVDAHRSIAFVISPYVKRHFVDHTMYSTSGVLRTIELILGLPPMSQYDAAATPMWRAFTSTPDFTPYTARPANVDINARNTADNALARESAKFNLAVEDAAPDIPFNEVIWKAVKGIDSEMPAPRHSAFVLTHGKNEPDEE
ncbi:MAG: bifunctional YncE family protein/alkaline phosphatase family protein [Thermoflavifilum aggregans]|nr:bifunctional YncE family protein/alkaline phosphatase family protein [Thermoflavifilum aggregans]